VVKSSDVQVKEYMLDQIICGLDADLQEPVDPVLGFADSNWYQDQLRGMTTW
jgi:hypothetical protein